MTFEQPQKIAMVVLLLLVLSRQDGCTPLGPSIDANAPLQVVIFEESADRGKISADQLAAIVGTADGLPRAYVKAKGGQFYALDVTGNSGSLAKAPQFVQDAAKLERASLPWLVVIRGKAVFSGPLPPTKADQQKILYRYGGNP